MLAVQGTKCLGNNVFLNILLYSGMIIPGGFGNRGIEGKILAAKDARERRIPFLGMYRLG